jgi:Na+/H+ antiporter NhaD/arsenite permease-like protein
VREGARVTFARFMRIGLPITLCQLAVVGLYILALSWLAS